MKYHWKKLGQLYVPRESGQHPKLLSHAANPLPLHLAGDTSVSYTHLTLPTKRIV